MPRSSSRPVAHTVALVALVAMAACRRGDVPSVAAQRPASAAKVAPQRVPVRQAMTLRPAPTEHVLDEGAEKRSNQGRKAWIESLHRAAPGTDWRELERENGLELMRRRARALIAKDYQPGTWTERGSANQAGRMHAAALGLDGSTLYAGSSHGGAWRGANDGSSWTPIGDNLFGGAHRVAVGAAPAETILALTNWGRLRYTQDQGATWLAPAGLPADLNGGKNLFSDPADRSRVYLLAHRPGGMEVFRSDDGGLSWISIRTLSEDAADMWIDRVAGGTLWVLAGGELWSTADQGGRWTQESVLGVDAYDDAALAGSEAGAPTLYAALHVRDGAWELRRSDNAGRGWVRLADLDDFWSVLEASIGDPDVVAKGGVELFRSANGGMTWTLMNPWWAYYNRPVDRLHADMMGIDVVMLGGAETWLIGTDGGLYRSDDRLANVRNLSLRGLRVSQYYSTHTSVLDSTRVLAGAQDQGYQRALAPGAPLQDFDQLISGDYGHLTSGDRTHAFVYSTYPGFILVHEGEDAPVLAQLDFPAGSRPQWLPKVVADPTNREAFYFCADRLWRYERDVAGTWTSYQETTQNFTVAGGWTLTALSISWVDPLRRLAATDAGALWYSDDGGLNWTPSADSGPDAHYFSGTALEHSPDDPLVAVVAGAGYSGPAAYETVDGGRTWTPIGDGLPRTLVYDIAWAGPGSRTVFAATEAGPYRFDPALRTWEYIGGTLAPLTTYWSVESIPEIGTIRYGTYGRGIWDWQESLVPEASHCADGVDNEGDGLVDCDDPDCVGLPDCLENCANGLDDDRDGDTDCADVDCLSADTDGDGRQDCVDDCAPAEADEWSLPGEVAELRVSKPDPAVAQARLTWTDEQIVAAGSGTRHDAVIGNLDVLLGGRWPAGALCIGNDLAALGLDDIMTGIPSVWYLVRAQNSCGAGPWGSGDVGPARPVPGCP